MLPEIFSSMDERLADILGIDQSFDTQCRSLVITGDNAQGKSLLRRIIGLVCKEDDIEVINLSQEGRARPGIQRAFIYGDENKESTGAISAKTFKVGMRTSRSRTHDHLLLWDEPEIGMGEELQLGTALWVKEQLEDWPKKLRGLIVMTHSRYFVSELMDMPDSKFYNMNGCKTSHDWLSRKIEPTNPEEFGTKARDRFRTISKILEQIRA